MSQSGQPEPDRIDPILQRHPRDPSSIVNVLHDIQQEYRYLPEQALRATAGYLGVSHAELYSVASFFEGFHLKPRGKHTCTVCMGTACHVRGAPRLLEQLERELKIGSGQTTQDLTYTLQEVNCVGACALGPLVILDDVYHGNMNSARLSKLIGKTKK